MESFWYDSPKPCSEPIYNAIIDNFETPYSVIINYKLWGCNIHPKLELNPYDVHKLIHELIYVHLPRIIITPKWHLLLI